MRKLIYAINLTLDGGCDHTNGVPDEEMFEYHTHLVRDADLLVFGRKTYQLMVPYWPDVAKNPSETKEDSEFAEAFVSKNKVVFSRSLESAEDKNTTIVRTNLRDEIRQAETPARQLYFGRRRGHPFATYRAWPR